MLRVLLTLFALAIASLLFLSAAPALPSLSPATAFVIFPSDSRSIDFAPSAGELSIINPAFSERIPSDMDAPIQVAQFLDMTPIQSAFVQVDDGAWVSIPLSTITIYVPEGDAQTNPPGRIITFTNLFAWRPDGTHVVGAGNHTIKIKIKTSLPNEFVSEMQPYMLALSPTPTFLEGGGMSNGYASFDAPEWDCSKVKKCTHTLTFYIPMLPKDSKSFAAKKAEAAATNKKVIDKLFKEACIEFSIKYKKLKIPKNAKGINLTTGVVFDAEDFMHSLTVEKDAMVYNENGSGGQTFGDEKDDWTKDGAIPVIVPDDVALPNRDDPTSNDGGVTFTACNGTMFSDTGKPSGTCSEVFKTTVSISKRGDFGNQAHELGHNLMAAAGFPAVSSSGEENHHLFDFGTKDPLPKDNFMGTKFDTDQLNITKKQAEGIYNGCKELKGKLGSYSPRSTNYCQVSNGGVIVVGGASCTTDGGIGDNENEESCAGSTRFPGIPNGNFGNSSNDVCKPEDNCAEAWAGTHCDFAKCLCVPNGGNGGGPIAGPGVGGGDKGGEDGGFSTPGEF